MLSLVCVLARLNAQFITAMKSSLRRSESENQKGRAVTVYTGRKCARDCILTQLKSKVHFLGEVDEKLKNWAPKLNRHSIDIPTLVFCLQNFVLAFASRNITLMAFQLLFYNKPPSIKTPNHFLALGLYHAVAWSQWTSLEFYLSPLCWGKGAEAA